MIDCPQQLLTAQSNALFQQAEQLLTPHEVHYLVDGLIEQGSMSLLFSLPGMGKSFLAIDWAASIATGTPWQKRKVKRGGVFYLAGEGHSGFRRRLRAWELARGISLAGAPLFFSNGTCDLSSKENIERIVNEIDMLKLKHGTPELIIIDTYARSMGSNDENSNADAGLFITHLDIVRQYLNCGILIIHHTGHNDYGRPRGASALPAAMDSIFRLDGKNENGRFSDLKLTHLKSKEGELIPSLPLGIESIELTGWLDSEGRTMTSAAIAVGTKGDQDGGILNNLSESERTGLKVFIDTAKQKGKFDQNGIFLGLDVELWREEFYRSSLAPSIEAKKKSFRRARKALEECNLISEVAGIAKPADNAGSLFEAINAASTPTSTQVPSSIV